MCPFWLLLSQLIFSKMETGRYAMPPAKFKIFKTFSKFLWLKVRLPPSKKVAFICFNEHRLKVIKNAFYFMLKAIFVVEISKFLSWLLGYVEKRFDKKAKVNFKIYDVTYWTTNTYDIHITESHEVTATRQRNLGSQ